MISISVDRIPSSASSKRVVLPRIGLFVDVAGRRITVKSAGVVESLSNLRDLLRETPLANRLKSGAKKGSGRTKASTRKKTAGRKRKTSTRRASR